MLRTWVGPVPCAVAVLLAATPIAAQTTIGNEGDPAVGSHSYANFPAITYGQTFTAPNPTDVFLQTFRISVGSNPSFPYTVRLMEWTGATAGAVLFSEMVAATPLSRSYVEFNVNQLLNFGAQYIFALSVVSGGVDVANFISFTSTYAGGNEAYSVSADLASIQGGAWFVRPGFDVGFSATFVPGQQVVPEPMTMVLLGTGLLGLGVVRRRRVA
jgi:hypothetical protein